MRILVTNDDGIDSIGLHVLARAMCRHGEVVVAAPGNDGLKDEILSIRAELKGILELIDAHDSQRKED